MSDEVTLGEENINDLPEKGTIVQEKGLGHTLTVDRKNLLKAAAGLKEAGFDLFLFVSGVDYPDHIKLIYRIYSSKRKNKVGIIIKTEVPKSDPVVDSLVPLWSAANWHERETYDLFGVTFKGHPDMRRIFMPQDWVGYPLRKDYSDDHMIVMDDGKEEKSAIKGKSAAVSNAKTEKIEQKTTEAPQQRESTESGQKSLEIAERAPKDEVKQGVTGAVEARDAESAMPESASNESAKISEQVNEANTGGSDKDE